MKTSKLFLGSALLIALATTAAFAAETPVDGAAVVNFVVPNVHLIAVSGEPTLTLVAPAAGSQFSNKSNADTSKLAITSNAASTEKQKITAKLDAAAPTGLTLSLLVGAITGHATEQEAAKVLTTTAQDLVTDLYEIAESDIAMTYEITANVTAAVTASAHIDVTLTLTDQS